MRVIGTIEARMGSTRLPGKTLAEIYEGMLLLDCVVSRFRLASCVDDVVVATTVEPGDDAIAEWCQVNGVSVYRGSENDVLDRVARAAKNAQADVIVQMGADSAYLDYSLVDELVTYYRSDKYDYVCNDLKLTYPLGIYAHVVNVDALCALNEQSGLSHADREDVVRYFWEHPERYRILNLEATSEYAFPQIRLTIDYPEDMALAKVIYRHFGGYRFSTEDIIKLYRKSPDIFAAVDGLVQESAPFIGTQQ